MVHGSKVSLKDYSVYIKSNSCQIKSISNLFSENKKGNVLFMNRDGVKMCEREVSLVRAKSFSNIKPCLVPLSNTDFNKLVKSSSRTLRSGPKNKN